MKLFAHILILIVLTTGLSHCGKPSDDALVTERGNPGDGNGPPMPTPPSTPTPPPLPPFCVAGASLGQVSCVDAIANSAIAMKSKSCNSTGTAFVYGVCTLQTCENGYNISGNACVAQACTPNQSYSNVGCTGEIPNSASATKTKTCNTLGTDYNYGSCILQSCSTGYNISGNACVLAPMPEVANLRCFSSGMMARWDTVTNLTSVGYYYVHRATSSPLPSACSVTDNYTTLAQTNGGLFGNWWIRVCVYDLTTGRTSTGVTLSCP